MVVFRFDMIRRESLSSAVVLVCASLVACAQPITVGGFALDVPAGWSAESDEPNTYAVGTDDAEWTFVMIAFSADSIEGDKSLDAVGKTMAAELAKDDDTSDDIVLEFAEPKTWSKGGIEGLTMDGKMSEGGLSIQLQLMIVVAANQYMVAFGFRGPHAGAKHDKAKNAMLDSLRLAG